MSFQTQKFANLNRYKQEQKENMNIGAINLDFKIDTIDLNTQNRTNGVLELQGDKSLNLSDNYSLSEALSSDKNKNQKDIQQQLVLESGKKVLSRIKKQKTNNHLYISGEKKSDELKSSQKSQIFSLCSNDNEIISNQYNNNTHKRISVINHNNNEDQNKQAQQNSSNKHQAEQQLNIQDSQVEIKRSVLQKKSFQHMLRQSTSSFQQGWNQIQFIQRSQKQNRLKTELETIDQNMKYKQIQEKFIILFNKNPGQSFQYLEQTELFDLNDKNLQIQQIALLLLNTEGLSKQSIGKFFGKDEELNLKVLEQYCLMIDFKDLEFDEAVRIFLSKFMLPGEAQQIDRIVERLAKSYCEQNPQTFENSDVAHILAYSIIQLHTDAHNPMIKPKDKMKKHNFVRINKQINQQLTEQYLENIYDRIIGTKFKIGQDNMERIYNRIGFGSLQQNLQSNQVENIQQELLAGNNFLKYCRKGQPKQRRVFLNDMKNRVCWCKLNEQNSNLYEEKRSILIDEIVDILLGCSNTEVMVRNNVPVEFDLMCFSIKTKERTLDLKANSIEIRAKWIQYIKYRLNMQMMCNQQQLDTQMVENNFDGLRLQNKASSSSKKYLDEIWKIDIFPYWEKHWDYQKKAPKSIKKYRLLQQKSIEKPFISKITKYINYCFNYFRKDQIKYQTYMDQDNQTSQELNELCGNKSLLLVTLWKKGLPDWVRRTIWPTVIENMFYVNESLQQKLEQMVQQIQTNQNPFCQEMQTIFSKIQSSTRELQIPEHEEQINKILTCFCVYRPDIGFINGMEKILAILVSSLEKDQLFESFFNLVQKYHFAYFFSGDLRLIKQILEIVDLIFQKQVPILYKQFKYLNLSLDLFIINWFITFFYDLFEIEFIKRLFDCLLLDGELFIIKTSIGILKFFELDLKFCTLDDVLLFFRQTKQKIFNYDQLFQMIEGINYSIVDFEDFKKKQEIAYMNSQIHQTLLLND